MHIPSYLLQRQIITLYRQANHRYYSGYSQHFGCVQSASKFCPALANEYLDPYALDFAVVAETHKCDWQLNGEPVELREKSKCTLVEWHNQCSVLACDGGSKCTLVEWHNYCSVVM